MVAGKHPPVQVVQVAGGEPPAVQLHHRPQLRRQHRQHGHNHILHPVFAAPEGFQQPHPPPGLGPNLRRGGPHLQRGVIKLLVQVQIHQLQELQHRLRPHIGVESVPPEGLQPFVAAGGQRSQLQPAGAAAGNIKLIGQVIAVPRRRRQFQILPQPVHFQGQRTLGRIPPQPAHGLDDFHRFLAPFHRRPLQVAVNGVDEILDHLQLVAPEADFLLPFLVFHDARHTFQPFLQRRHRLAFRAGRPQPFQQGGESRQPPASPFRVILRAAVVPGPDFPFHPRQRLPDFLQLGRHNPRLHRIARPQIAAGEGGMQIGQRRRQGFFNHRRHRRLQPLRRVGHIVLPLLRGVFQPARESRPDRRHIIRQLLQRLRKRRPGVMQPGNGPRHQVALYGQHRQPLRGNQVILFDEMTAGGHHRPVGAPAHGRQRRQRVQRGAVIAPVLPESGSQVIQRVAGAFRGHAYRLGHLPYHARRVGPPAFLLPLHNAPGQIQPRRRGRGHRLVPQRLHFGAVLLQLSPHQVNVNLGDDIGRVVQHAGQLGELHIQRQAHHAGRVFDEPDVRHRRRQLNMPHPFPAHLGAGHLHAAAVADHAVELLALELPALAFPVLGRPENLFAKQPVLLGPLRAVVDGLPLLNLAPGPGFDLVRRSHGDANGVEIRRASGFPPVRHPYYHI